jgi:hypothetical protein
MVINKRRGGLERFMKKIHCSAILCVHNDSKKECCKLSLKPTELCGQCSKFIISLEKKENMTLKCPHCGKEL